MTMARMPGTAPAGQGTGPGRRTGGLRFAGFSIRLTRGAYILAMLAVVVSALSLDAAAPGWPGAYAAATAGVVVLLLASMIGHELAHAAAARRHGARCGEISVGLFGGTAHGRYQLPTPRAQCQAAAAGPVASLAAAGISGAAAAGLSALGAGQLAVVVFAVAAWINAVLGVASLLPGAGSDGGQIIRALAWARTGDPVRADRGVRQPRSRVDRDTFPPRPGSVRSGDRGDHRARLAQELTNVGAADVPARRRVQPGR